MPAPGPAPVDGVAAPRAAHAWERFRWAWHVAAGAVLAVATTGALTDSIEGRTRVAIAGLVAVLVAHYWTCWSRSATEDGQRWGTAYVGGAIGLWLALTSLHPAFFLLLFLLYSHCYMHLEIRRAIVAACLLTVGVGAMHWSGGSISGHVCELALLGLGVVASALLGLWIHAIISQSREREDLIEELERTRHELAGIERQAGVLEERQRLAAEIHDTLAQGFTSVVMLSQAVDVGLGPDTPAPVRRQVALIGQTARENLAEARRLLAALTPAPLSGTSLVDALSRLTDRLSEETDVAVTTVVVGAAHPLPPAKEVAVLRAAQESLANIRRHASATTVGLTLTYDADGGVELDVRDDGVGFELDDARDGYGLPGLQRRIEKIGGRVDIDSAPGRGTRVTVGLS